MRVQAAFLPMDIGWLTSRMNPAGMRFTCGLFLFQKGVKCSSGLKGTELFYRTENRMMAVDISTQPTFSAGKPRMLFEGSSYLRTPGAGIYYSVFPDGQRFLMLKRQDQQQTGANQINVIGNWFEELKSKVPVTSTK